MNIKSLLQNTIYFKNYYFTKGKRKYGRREKEVRRKMMGKN